MRKYSDEMDKMQQEAVRRMQEMQSRGKSSVVAQSVNSERKQSIESQANSVHNEKDNCKVSSSKQTNFFESVFHDKERSLILLLLLLLSTEKTDTGLILALVYLLI